MKLNFEIDDNYLIAHTLAAIDMSRYSSEKHMKDIQSFQRMAWKRSRKCYNILTGQPKPGDLSAREIETISEELSSFLSALRKSPHFRKVRKQTAKYLESCKRQWQDNHDVTYDMISEITGFKPRKSFIVYITHPGLKNGRYLGNNEIAWGHSEEWPNYTTVYLWHEIMHSYFDTKPLDHVIISFITDEELRVRLNGGRYPPFMTHGYLHPAMEKVLPLWRKYLKSGSGGIYGFKAGLLETQI